MYLYTYICIHFQYNCVQYLKYLSCNIGYHSTSNTIFVLTHFICIQFTDIYSILIYVNVTKRRFA